MTAIYFILSLILFYYAFKFGMRLLLPFAMKKLSERMMKKANQGQGGFYTFGAENPFSANENYNRSSKQSNNDAQVRVEFVPKTAHKRKGTETAGEFIDFEEIK